MTKPLCSDVKTTRFGGKMNHYGIVLLLIVLLVSYPSFALAEGTASESNLKEYLQRFVDTVSYQLPDPASTLTSLIISSPDLAMGGLKAWAMDNLQKSMKNLMDADYNGNKEQIDYYENQLDRWQAILSCLNGDCSRMKELERSDSSTKPSIESSKGELILVSDTQTKWLSASGEKPAELVWVPSVWSQYANIPDASWIWSSSLVDSVDNMGPIEFNRVFTIPQGATSITGTIQITADNKYSLFLNNAQIGESDNWQEVKTYQITPKPGENTLKIEALNFGPPIYQVDPYKNPAGLIYRAEIKYGGS